MYVFVCVCACVHMSLCVHASVCVYTCMWAGTHIHMYGVHAFVCVCSCVCVCTCVCVWGGVYARNMLFYSSLLYFWRQGLSLDLAHTDSARLAER